MEPRPILDVLAEAMDRQPHQGPFMTDSANGDATSTGTDERRTNEVLRALVSEMLERVRDASGRSMTFSVTDGAHVYPVSYRGLPPDTFTDGVDVVLEGRLAHDGTFRATTVLAKCASRYENAPEKYRSTPGYTSAPAAVHS
jgi:cytochrome c-type biogenesis protein CcmE